MFLAWRPKHAYLCTKYANSISRYLVWVCLKCTMPKVCIFGLAPQPRIRMVVSEVHDAQKVCIFVVTPQTRIPLHQIIHQPRFWMPCMVVFEMPNAKKCVFLGWRPKRAYLCTKYVTNSISGYLVWLCLKCTMPESVRSWPCAPNAHTHARNIQSAVFLNPSYGGV